MGFGVCFKTYLSQNISLAIGLRPGGGGKPPSNLCVLLALRAGQKATSFFFLFPGFLLPSSVSRGKNSVIFLHTTNEPIKDKELRVKR